MNPQTKAEKKSLIYLRITEPGTVNEIAEQLSREGIPTEYIHVYSADPERLFSTPVKVSRYRSPRASMAFGAVTGLIAGTLVGVPLLALGGLGIAPLLVLMVGGGVSGAIYRLWVGNGPSGELYRLDTELTRGETVIVVETDIDRAGELQNKINLNHPNVFVLGADPQGTPPFP